MKQPVPSECCITHSNGPIAGCDPKCAGKIDCYHAQCHYRPCGTAVKCNLSYAVHCSGLLVLMVPLIHSHATLQRILGKELVLATACIVDKVDIGNGVTLGPLPLRACFNTL